MGIVNRKTYAGRPDINAQFTAKNIKKTLADYNEVKRQNGDYTFGALTAKYYHLGEKATAAWENDIRVEYPNDVQDEIKRHIIHALTHRDDHGQEDPIPLTIKWEGGKKKEVVVTYIPSDPSYRIEIIGFLAPAASPLAGRRHKPKTD
jgi:hypothetical protein